MMNEEELKALASQLSRPEGDLGVQVANTMNESNIGMTIHAIKRLVLSPGADVLEIGHGNCGHLEKFLALEKDLKYTGLEISEQMQQEARRINDPRLSEDVRFLLYDGETLPFADRRFDAAFSVNTLYFWKEPAAFLDEVCRVLKNGGVFNLSFAGKEFMSTLPFTKYGFTLYSPEDFSQLAETSAFSAYKYEGAEERVTSKTGETVDRKFYTFSLIK